MWQVLCNKSAIIERSKLYNQIRIFFAERDVLEVETPLLSPATVTDPFIDSFEVFGAKDSQKKNKLYLQTSPEFCMKRLLCCNTGSIYQICKAFRSEEDGRKHNKEFTMLEWYRVGYKLDGLMDEVGTLLSNILQLTQQKIKKYTYQQLFKEYFNFDCYQVDIDFLKNQLLALDQEQYITLLSDPDFNNNYTADDLLMILLCDYIESRFPKDTLIFLYDYPPTQAALAKIDTTQQYPVAKRFEVYFNGMELANGYYELADSQEQKTRYEKDLAKRKKLNFPSIVTDSNLIAALESGLPDCSGVAMGLDRLLMLKLGTSNIEDVLTFR